MHVVCLVTETHQTNLKPVSPGLTTRLHFLSLDQIIFSFYFFIFSAPAGLSIHLRIYSDLFIQSQTANKKQTDTNTHTHRLRASRGGLDSFPVLYYSCSARNSQLFSNLNILSCSSQFWLEISKQVQRSLQHGHSNTVSDRSGLAGKSCFD